MDKTEVLAELLTSEIRGGNPAPGKPFPPIRSSASRFGVSFVTMHRVYRNLAGRGLIARRPGSKAYVALEQPDETAMPLEPAEAGLSSLAKDLRARVLRGDYHAPARLPCTRELAAAFGHRESTVRRVLAELESEGVILRHGRGYAPFGTVPRPKPTGEGRVWFLADRGIYNSYRDQMAGFMLAMERTRQGLGWPPIRTLLSPDFASPSGLPGSSEVAGFVVVLTRGADSIMAGVGARYPRVPVVVVDPSETYNRHTGRWNLVRRIAPDNYAVGLQVGMAIRAAGHRHVAYFDVGTPAGARWRLGRLAGLREAFAPETGGSFRRFAVDEEIPTQVRTGPYSMPPDPDRTITEGMRTVYLGRMDFVFGHLLAVGKSPAFARALAHPEISAWVCVHDGIAAVAAGILSRKGIGVPERLSLVAFDNTHMAAQAGITSYDFGFDRMGHLAIGLLARLPRTDSPRLMTHRVEGELVMRESLGAPALAEP